MSRLGIDKKKKLLEASETNKHSRAFIEVEILTYLHISNQKCEEDKPSNS
jgi:hypothetical protein